MSRLRLHPEHHLVGRIGWLRAVVLGANDGIISTASLIVGVAEAAEIAGTTVGAMKVRAHRGYEALRKLLGGKPDSAGPVQIFGQGFPAAWVIAAGTSLIAIALVYVYLYRTRLGTLTRAVMSRRDEAFATGIAKWRAHGSPRSHPHLELALVELGLGGPTRRQAVTQDGRRPL